jgi:hypothetical protein
MRGFERKQLLELARIAAGDPDGDAGIARIGIGKPAFPFFPRFSDQASAVVFHGAQHCLRHLMRGLAFRLVTIVQAGHCRPFTQQEIRPSSLGSALKLL